MQIQLRDISKRYWPDWALRDVSADIPAGSICAVIGANGAGKTTLLHILSGLIAPAAGEVCFDGVPFRRDDIAMRRTLVYLQDTPAVPDEMTPIMWAGMVFQAYEIELGDGQKLVDRWRQLGVLEFAEHPFKALSRGQLYKAVLAIAMELSPRLCLLDEPFASGIDPRGLALMQRFCRDCAAAGGTVLFTTQIVAMAEQIADLFLVIDHGRNVFLGTSGELQAAIAAGSLPMLGDEDCSP